MFRIFFYRKGIVNLNGVIAHLILSSFFFFFGLEHKFCKKKFSIKNKFPKIDFFCFHNDTSLW